MASNVHERWDSPVGSGWRPHNRLRHIRTDARKIVSRRQLGDLVPDHRLADLPAQLPFPWYRSRAEAASLEARDDIEGALSKLDEGERSILVLPDRT